jgi:hypothetical protein
MAADKDRVYLYAVLAAIAVAVLYETWKHKGAGSANCGIPVTLAPSEASGAFPIPWCEPMNVVYCANPSAYAPPTAEALTINISCQTAAQLNNQFMPLFGFVGVAQGTTWGGGLNS